MIYGLLQWFAVVVGYNDIMLSAIVCVVHVVYRFCIGTRFLSNLHSCTRFTRSFHSCTRFTRPCMVIVVWLLLQWIHCTYSYINPIMELSLCYTNDPRCYNHRVSFYYNSFSLVGLLVSSFLFLLYRGEQRRMYVRNKNLDTCDITPFHGYYFLWWLFIQWQIVLLFHIEVIRRGFSLLWWYSLLDSSG